MRVGLIIAAASMALLGCEPRLALRPVELDLEGLSSQAQTLNVGVDLADSTPSCAELTPATALALSPLRRVTWTRGQDVGRTLELEAVDDMSVRIFAVSLDAAEQPLQIGCDTIDFEAVERPERRLVLRMVP